MLALIKLSVKYLLFGIAVFFSASSSAQFISDSNNVRIEIPANTEGASDSIIRVISPRKAAIRSAIIPGWGQVYARKDLDASFIRKYWTLPVIYGTLGTTAGVFAYNLTWYRRTRFAYRVLITKDTSEYANVHPRLQYFVLQNQAPSLQNYRNEFRRNIDYSALFFVVFWGLNVVHASVEAHLRGFDVSPDLSLKFVPGYSDMAGTNGVSIILSFK